MLGFDTKNKCLRVGLEKGWSLTQRTRRTRLKYHPSKVLCSIKGLYSMMVRTQIVESCWACPTILTTIMNGPTHCAQCGTLFGSPLQRRAHTCPEQEAPACPNCGQDSTASYHHLVCSPGFRLRLTEHGLETVATRSFDVG